MKAGAKKLLDDLRRARVLVVHPQDEDGAALVAHLNRLGCEVRRVWPLPPSVPGDVDTLFVLIDELPVVDQLSTMLDEKNPAIIAIVTYESPTSLKAIIDLNAHGVISKPLRPLGVLTQFALARYRHGYEARLAGKVAKLEDTLKGRRQVEKATKILDVNGATVLVVEQNLDFALKIADRWAVLKLGAIDDQGGMESDTRERVLEHLKI